MGSTNEDLDSLIEEMTMDAYGEHDELLAFLGALRDELDLPAAASVIDTPVSILALNYTGEPRQGLTATCEKDGRRYTVSVMDLALPPDSPAAVYLAAYRRWLGLEPFPGTPGRSDS